MQFQFNFNAPTFYNFLQRKSFRSKDQNKLQIEDQNDKWFTILHKELTPIKKQTCQEMYKQENKPILRKTMFQIQHRKSQEKKGKHTKRRNTNLDQHQPFKKKQEKIPKIVRAKTVQPEKKSRANSMFIRNDKKPKEIIKQKSVKISGKIPCPFSTRVQRQWEETHKSRWYNLSDEAMKKASISMKKIQHKSLQLKDKEKASVARTQKDKKFKF